MDPIASELSSVITQLKELLITVGTAGERLDAERTADAAAALFEGERALRSAVRAVERAVARLG